MEQLRTALSFFVDFFCNWRFPAEMYSTDFNLLKMHGIDFSILLKVKFVFASMVAETHVLCSFD